MTEDHAMTAGLIPVRHAALPGVVKLPRRYEKAALGDPRTARYRKVSICAGPLTVGDGMSDRLDDLMTAIMWVKQELILLRQHDILLKRQFFDIHHSIRSPQPKNQLTSSCSSSTSSSLLTPTSPTSPTSPLHTSVTAPYSNNNNLSHSDPLSPPAPSDVSDDVTTSTPDASPVLSGRKRSSSGRLPASFSHFYMEALIVRPSSSATLLNSVNDNDDDDDEDTDGDDTFDDEFFRPRTSSMRTSRDLAALARRRGSKELI
ncbi:putative protein TPRXL [Aplysia californica]|uniref:Uncharacterized protein n=1 Tax=Aplysia californica TaxID=6500 RepID=A0ABM0JHW4_APLCA|nr:putative protein TPRXL [Aplysia californica]